MKHSHRYHRLATLTATVVVAVSACSDAPSPIDTTVDRTRRSAALRSYDSCDALAADLRDNTAERVRTQLLQQREMLRDSDGGWFRGGLDVDGVGGGAFTNRRPPPNGLVARTTAAAPVRTRRGSVGLCSLGLPCPAR